MTLNCKRLWLDIETRKYELEASSLHYRGRYHHSAFVHPAAIHDVHPTRVQQTPTDEEQLFTAAQLGNVRYQGRPSVEKEVAAVQSKGGKDSERQDRQIHRQGTLVQGQPWAQGEYF